MWNSKIQKGRKRKRTQKEGNEAIKENVFFKKYETLSGKKKPLAQALTTTSRKERSERLSTGLKVKCWLLLRSKKSKLRGTHDIS